MSSHAPGLPRWAAGGPGAHGDRGQISVEMLGITPLILVVLLLVWQFVLVGYTYTLAGNAADEAARAAAVGADPQAAARADLPQAWTDGAAASVSSGTGDVVTARVSLRVPMLLPGFLDVPFLTVDGDAGAARERPR
ncbi:TadE/TadG family type IV pilus assembly protein [Streptantibioticus ferralitis]|uniref:TadE/TadG family type IV pilus assembly protein n=1 Tax=Streptantibioticus ferralitis TaxID=236510 RepID=A0ABT5ZC00_9ACTN|nr:TadE/TadG family type IV pilus assembly protein [Streptantibioticus ferralitis]MDF2261371.1 TadE/TadG family type IV pilus assembly protein [Streptantibioticus ferralitis]